MDGPTACARSTARRWSSHHSTTPIHHTYFTYYTYYIYYTFRDARSQVEWPMATCKFHYNYFCTTCSGGHGTHLVPAPRCAEAL